MAVGKSDAPTATKTPSMQSAPLVPYRGQLLARFEEDPNTCWYF